MIKADSFLIISCLLCLSSTQKLRDTGSNGGISIGIAALILLYVSYLIAFNVPVIYTIDIGSKGDTDSGNNAYIRDLTAQGRISESMSDETGTFRIMKGSPVYFHVTPKNSISNIQI